MYIYMCPYTSTCVSTKPLKNTYLYKYLPMNMQNMCLTAYILACLHVHLYDHPCKYFMLIYYILYTYCIHSLLTYIPAHPHVHI